MEERKNRRKSSKNKCVNDMKISFMIQTESETTVEINIIHWSYKF